MKADVRSDGLFAILLAGDDLVDKDDVRLSAGSEDADRAAFAGFCDDLPGTGIQFTLDEFEQEIADLDIEVMRDRVRQL